MDVSAFDFELPRNLIAQRPFKPRDRARLLQVMPTGLTDRHVSDLPALLDPGDLLVFNDTRVLPARLRGKRGEAGVEVTLHQPVDEDRWHVFAKPAKKCQIGDRLDFAGDLHADVIGKGEHGEVTLRFSAHGAALIDCLKQYGQMPLPPYITRPKDGDASDALDYQTMFAQRDGAVAAPTASLHFTPTLLDALTARGIAHAFVTLHVGAGTFLPVRSKTTDGHDMHTERYELTEKTTEAIRATKERGKRVIACGTTVLRALEAAALKEGGMKPGADQTTLFITPGFRFQIADRLLTNFHLPCSTLFMLVAAFSGLGRMQSAYGHAIEQRYRFFSYGDACLLSPGTDAPKERQ